MEGTECFCGRGPHSMPAIVFISVECCLGFRNVHAPPSLPCLCPSVLQPLPELFRSFMLSETRAGLWGGL